ncbi:MAG TPA: hypothetical protein VJ746_06015 [Nitrospira sp.]|nr:hypothetical protein [Nitrospira sp.]
MPRAQAKRIDPESAWRGASITLDETVREDLLFDVGLDEETDGEAISRMITDIQRLLGDFPNLVKRLDGEPELANIATELPQGLVRAETLIDWIDNITDRAKQELDEDYAQLRQDIDRLVVQKIELVLRKANRGTRTNHRPKKHAVRFVIHRLFRIFVREYRPVKNDEGRIQNPKRASAMDFVETAFRGGDITPPGHNLLDECWSDSTTSELSLENT